MATRTTFSILTKPAGFFSHNGHDDSDEEIDLKAEVESYSDGEFSMQSDDFSMEGGDFSMKGGELEFNEELGGMPLFIDIQGPVNDMGMSGLDIPGEVVNPGLRGELDALFDQHYEGGEEEFDIFNNDGVVYPEELSEEQFFDFVNEDFVEEIGRGRDYW